MAHSLESLHLNFLLLMGLAIFGGTLGARLFKRIHFPQVVGYIVIGLFFGESFFVEENKFFDADTDSDFSLQSYLFHMESVYSEQS